MSVQSQRRRVHRQLDRLRRLINLSKIQAEGIPLQAGLQGHARPDAVTVQFSFGTPVSPL